MKKYLFLILALITFSACKKKEVIRGCTDSVAINYHPLAKEDDGSCRFHYYESDSLKGEYIPTFINNNYNFPYEVSFLIAIKNSYNISSNYGYEGEYHHGTAYAYRSGYLNTSECWFDNSLKIKNSSSQLYDLSCNGTMWHSNSNSINFEDGNFRWLNGTSNIIENNLGFINVGKINSGDVPINNGYSFEFDGITNFESSDSLIFAFHSPNKTLFFSKPVNSPNSMFFSSVELDGLNQGIGYIEIVALKFKFSTGFDVIHMNETIRTKKVNFY